MPYPRKKVKILVKLTYASPKSTIWFRILCGRFSSDKKNKINPRDKIIEIKDLIHGKIIFEPKNLEKYINENYFIDKENELSYLRFYIEKAS